MKVIITGATGMVGEGVLFECLANKNVTEVLIVNRKHYNLDHPKLKELLIPNFLQLENFSEQLKGYDACFYCAGISSIGIKEEEFTRITYDTTLSFAKQLFQLNPATVFNFVSGNRTDSSEIGKVMWARVKGKTENALMKLYGKNQYNFRPAIMKATKGQVNVKRVYKILAPIIAPFFPQKTLTLQQVGRAMINAVLKGYPKQILEVDDISQLAKQ
ncbi:NAD-dependent epimerase/dehydratase family protein [Flavobacterium zhairuonense]|uniref:NAD-dependent epimerase/dehydratase family protein n=1 Tax=Flavobacterium zhairuonense TaxID=2493631 RepID=UPI001048F36D|nr:NAD-dependent epimerase/dehydratase family protein [Flavobacterium zhairuonense]KAF2512810.1 NAD-dependent epimerase/dehydratase family protein [Flavobacterium zhairuonense]